MPIFEPPTVARRPRPAGWLLAGLALGLSVAGPARTQEPAGIVERVRLAEGGSALVFRSDGARAVTLDDRLFPRDLIELRTADSFLDLRLAQLRAVLGSQDEARSQYQIQSGEVDQLGRLEFHVLKGALVLQGVTESVVVFVAGTHSTLASTAYYEAFDEDRGFVYLEEGAIAFPTYDLRHEGPNRAWQLERGRPPVEIPLTVAAREAYRDAVDYALDDVWAAARRPFWQRPEVIVGAAVVVGGVGYLMYSQCVLLRDAGACDGDDAGPLTITVPLP